MPTPSDIPPLTRPCLLISSPTLHQLGTKHLNIQVCGGHSHSNHFTEHALLIAHLAGDFLKLSPGLSAVSLRIVRFEARASDKWQATKAHASCQQGHTRGAGATTALTYIESPGAARATCTLTEECNIHPGRQATQREQHA